MEREGNRERGLRQRKRKSVQEMQREQKDEAVIRRYINEAGG